MANNRVNVNLAFTADTKQAKQAIDNLHKQLDSLLNANVNLSLSERFTAEVKESQAAIAQLQVALNGAFNADTGRLDLSKFQESMQKSEMSLKKYQKILSDLGPAGDKAFSQLALAIVNSEIPLKRSNKLLTDMWTTMKNTARWQLSASVIQGFQGALQKAYGYAQDLNESLNNIRIVTSASIDDMAKFATEANKAAKALSTTTTEYTNASLIYYQQGLSAQEVKERTDVTIKMANVSRESAETVSDQMTAVWNNFADGSKSLEYYADVMTALGAATASSTAEITTGLEKFAAVAETVGLSYEYATTALATITDTTRQSADVVGNALKTLFARIQGLSLGETLEDGTDLNKYSEALMKVGISIKEQDGSLKKMDTILDEMANKWGTLAKDQQVALAQTVAGVRQYTQLVALMDNWDKFQKNLSVANNAAGALQEQADIYAESWEAARDRVTAAAEEIYSSLLNDEFFIDLTDGFAKMLDHINNLIKTLGGLPGVLAIVGTAFNKIFSKQLISGINNMTYSIRMLNPKNQQSVRDEKINAARALESQAVDKFSGNSAVAADLYRAQGNSIERYLEIEEKITEENRKQVEYLMAKQDADTQRAIQLAEQVDLIEDQTNEMYEQIEIAAKESVAKGYGQKKDLKTFTKSNNTARAMAKVQAQFTVEPVLNEKNLQKTKDRIKRALETVDTSSFTTQGKKAFAELSQVANDGAADVEEVSAAMKKFSETMQQESGKARSALSKLDDETEDLVASFDAAEDKTVSLKSGIREMSRAAEGASVSTGALDGAVEKLSKGKPLDLGTKINYIADALGNAAMLATSFKGIIDTWKDDDIPLMDKILSSLTTLSIVLPMVIGSFDKFYKLLVNNSMADLGKDIANAGGAMNFFKSGAGGATQALKKLGKSLLSVLPVLLAIGAAIGIIYFIWKQIKENSPEGQLEKATKVTEDLAQALNDAKTAAEELKNAIEGYESAEQALEDCVEGTKEYEEALRKANEAALELLRNNPELYSSGGVTRENGRIKISEEAYNGLQEKYINRQAILNGAYANSQQTTREKGIAKEWDDINKILDKADYKYSDESDAIRKLFTHQYNSSGGLTVEDLYQYRSANNPDYSELLNDPEIFSTLEQAIIELSSAVDENTIATQIESEQAVDELLDKDYSDAVIKSLGKTYNDKVNSEKEKFTWKDSNAELFEEYKNLMGLSGAIYSASENTYTINGETYNLTRDAMIEALAVNNAKNSIQTDADKLAKLLGNENTLQSRLVNEGAGSLSKAEMAKIDSSMLSEMVSLGAITQAVANKINAINPDDIDLNSLEDTLSADLQQTLNEVFGENWSQEEIGDLIGKIPADLRDEFAQAVSQTNWSDVDSAQGFHDLLTELGGWMPEDEVEGFVQQMMDANNAVKQLDLEKFKTDFYDTKELISELEKGDTISPEDYAKLNEAEKEYFTLTSDGTYMLTEDAKKFYDTVMGNRLEDAKERITQLQGDIDEFDKAYQEFQDYGGDADKLNNVQSASILLHAGVDITGMTNQEKIAEVKKLTEAYEDNKLKLNEVQAVLASMAEDETTLNKWLDEGKIDAEEYDKAMEVLRINQEKALKALNANVKGLEKSAPKITKALDAMNKGLDVDSPAFIEAINEVIEANPDLTGAVMSAYQTLSTAKVGTEEYAEAWKTLYNLLQHNASQNILEDNAKTAREQMEVLSDKAATVEERANALQNLNTIFGSDIFTDADKGAAALDNLRRALDGDKAAFKQLQEAVLDGILIKYNLNTGELDLSKFEEGCVYATSLAENVREALIASGLFEIVEREITVPAIDIPEGYNSSEDKIDGKILSDGIENIAFKEHKVKVQMIKPIGQNIGTRTMGTGSKSSGSKGTKKVSSDEKERYHVVNKQIEDLQAKYNEAGKIKDQAFGPAKESAALTELGYLDQLIEKERQYQAEIEQYLAKDKSALAEYGATFGEHGEITNYDALMDKEIAKYNAAIEKAGTNQEAQEAAEKAYELFIKALENYEGTYSAYLDKLATIQDLQNEKIDKELQNIQNRLDAKLDLEADQLKYLDYLIGKLDDEAFALADALVSLHDKTQPIMNQSDHYAQAWEELQRTAKENGGWTQDMIDKLRELRDGLISTNEEIMELQKTIEEKVNEAISECTDELDKQINRFDTYQNILQNYNDIIDLSGKKFKDYAMMLELSSLMTDNAINKLASSREKLETLGQAQINAQAKLELAEDSGDQDVIDYWKKTLEDIQIEVENATAEMGSAWKEALQAASDAFESQVNLAIDNFKGGLEAFGDLDMISESYDRAEKAAERYLEDFEKTHELSQLGRDITKAMNDTASAFAKDELAELMAEVNEKQKDGVKMSEYDLEVLKKKFELKQAELALEEAQNSMSQVRLTRDNEGNWSYQYTADQDKVDEALSEYEARLYEVAKLSDEYIDEMSKAVIDNQKEMYETLAGLRAEDFASYEEYEAKVREIVNFYTTQDAYLRDELAKAVGDTEYVTTTMSGHYDNLSTSFTTVVDTMLGNTGDKTGNLKTWMESTDNLAEQAEEYFNTELPKAYETWEKSVGDAMKAAGTNTEDFKTDVSGYMEDIGDASDILADDIGDAADDMQDYIEDVMDSVWDWQEEYAAAIREMIAANEALIQSMMAVAAAQGTGGGNEPADYSRAIAELLEDGASINDPQILEWLEKRAKKDAEGKYLSNDRLMKLFTAYDNGDEKAIEAVNGVLYNNKWFTDEYLKPLGFRTGGYTGAWGPEGKMAFVHEKELILNSDDTVNFLAGVNILREIAKMIDLQAANMAMPHGFTLPMSASSGGVLEQNVHISASFPGVQDRNEIEIALRSLVNEASQFVLE